MTYLGGERAVPHYNVMGVAKATLDASMRYLAWDLGQKNVRVNAISAGPVRTLAARSIAGFPTMEAIVEERAPLHRHVDADDVGAAAAFSALGRREERHRDDPLRRLGLSRYGDVTSAGRPSRKWTTERTPSSAGSSLPLRSARATRSASGGAVVE